MIEFGVTADFSLCIFNHQFGFLSPVKNCIWSNFLVSNLAIVLFLVVHGIVFIMDLWMSRLDFGVVFRKVIVAFGVNC